MEDKKIEIDCDLLAWIKDKSEKSGDSQIVLTVKDGCIIRASSHAYSVFNEEKR